MKSPISPSAPQVNVNEDWILASDLDGTIFPSWSCRYSDYVPAMNRLCELISLASPRVVYLTGRSLQSSLDGIQNHGAPQPVAIASDLGTRLYYKDSKATAHYTECAGYKEFVENALPGRERDVIRAICGNFDKLMYAEEKYQSRGRISYYSNVKNADQAFDLADALEPHIREVSQSVKVLSAFDEQAGIGYLDVVSADKRSALEWVEEKHFRSVEPNQVIVAGDSGPDIPLITSGRLAILVSNAARAVKARVEKALKDRSQRARLYMAGAVRGHLGSEAAGRSVAGVVDGILHFCRELVKKREKTR